MNRFNRYPTSQEIISRNKRVKIMSLIFIILAVIVTATIISIIFNVAMIALGIT